MSSPPFRVLLVEDEPVIRDLVQAMLEGAAAEVTAVGDGAEAVKAARQQRPNLVLLDVVLPGLDGLSVLRLLRADPELRATPIYMLTARARPADHEAAQRAGADGYIEKPFKAGELIALVEKVRGGGR